MRDLVELHYADHAADPPGVQTRQMLPERGLVPIDDGPEHGLDHLALVAQQPFEAIEPPRRLRSQQFAEIRLPAGDAGVREHRTAELPVGDVERAPVAVRVVAAGVDHRRVEHHGIAGGQLAPAPPGQRFAGELSRPVEYLLLDRGIAAPVASRHHPERVVVVQGDVPREHAGRVGLTVRLQAAQRERGRRPQHRVPVPLEDAGERLARLGEQGRGVEPHLRRGHEPAVDVQHPVGHQRGEQRRGVPVDEVVEAGVRHAVRVPAHVRVAARPLARPIQEQLGGGADRLELVGLDRATHDQVPLVQDRPRLVGLLGHHPCDLSDLRDPPCLPSVQQARGRACPAAGGPAAG